MSVNTTAMFTVDTEFDATIFQRHELELAYLPGNPDDVRYCGVGDAVNVTCAVHPVLAVRNEKQHPLHVLPVIVSTIYLNLEYMSEVSKS